MTALQALLSGPAMGFHVARQLAALGTGVRAQFTLVRLLPRMGSPVHGEVAAVLEHLAAVLTGIIPASADDLFSQFRIKYGIKPSLLGQGPNCAGLNLRQCQSMGKRKS